MKSKEYFEYKANVMKRFIDKANLYSGTLNYENSRTAQKQAVESRYDPYSALRSQIYKGQENQSISTDVDSDIRGSYCAVKRKNAASKDSVSSYKKYLAKVKPSVAETEVIPRKAAVRGSVETYMPT